MKFIVSSSTLLKHLSYVAGVVTSNPNLPILENLLFNIEKQKLTIVGTDADTVIQTHLAIDSNEEGSICIPSKILLESLKSITDQPVTFSINVEKDSIQLITANGNYGLKGENAKNFPKAPLPDNAQKFDMKSFTLLDAVSNTLFTVSNDETRMNMNGVFFDLKEDNSISFVSTDGHRMIKHTLLNVILPEKKESFIVPKKPLTILKNLLVDDDRMLNVSFSKKHLFVNTGDLTLICTLLNGTFPDYNSVIPKDNRSELIIDRKEFQNALKRVGIFSSRSNLLVRMILKGNTITLSAKDDDFSVSADEKLNCQYEGEDLTIGFNSKSFTELLNPIKSNEVKIKFSLPSKPALVLPAENQENVFLEMIQIPLMLVDDTEEA